MVSTSSFLTLELKADNMEEFLAKRDGVLNEESGEKEGGILNAGWQPADEAVCATGIITQHFWKAPDSFVEAEAEEDQG